MSEHSRIVVRQATLAGLVAYLVWGLSPLFFQLLNFAGALEIIFHRVIWAVPILFGVLWFSGQQSKIISAISNRRVLLTLLATAALISINWWTFIFAVNNGAILQASLGYFIGPLVSVLIGVVVLREPLGPWRLTAVLLATLGVLNQIISVGELPWISLLLAVSFSIYGYLRKIVAVDGRIGLFWETVFVFPFALGGLLWLYGNDASIMPIDLNQWSLLAIGGVITVVPLMLYIIGTRGLRLSTMGLLQFLAPSLQFVIGVMNGEPFTTAHLITFALIWSGVATFIFSQLRRDRVTS